jgi:hypothetical protein
MKMVDIPLPFTISMKRIQMKIRLFPLNYRRILVRVPSKTQ